MGRREQPSQVEEEKEETLRVDYIFVVIYLTYSYVVIFSRGFLSLGLPFFSSSFPSCPLEKIGNAIIGKMAKGNNNPLMGTTAMSRREGEEEERGIGRALSGEKRIMIQIWSKVVH